MACAMMACRPHADAAPSPLAEASAPAAKGPTGWSHLADATLVEVRDVSPSPKRDAVIRLERARGAFTWTAKVSPFPNALGELTPDTSMRRFVGCKCAVDTVCPCEIAEHALPIPAIKSGDVAAAVIDAFLKEVARHDVGGASDAGAWTSPRAHAGIFVPGSDMIHLAAYDAAWTANGNVIEGDVAPVDAAWRAILAAVGVDALLPPAPTLPSAFATMAKAATTLEIKDVWNGLGHTHDAFIHLDRAGASFRWTAKVASYATSLGERVPDPSTPHPSGAPCVCDVKETCACEHAYDMLKKTGTVPASLVEAFLAAVAKHAISTGDDSRAVARWTDDYPTGHVAVWTDADAPIHLSFLDQQRRWRANGADLALDPPVPHADMVHSEHPSINQPYQKLLAAIGVDAWAEELAKAPHGARRRPH